MSDWAEGYVADIAYTHGYYGELNPLRARFALLRAGYALPANATACELGFGQGVSINVHASASETEWHGTDFNPAQAGFAQELAAAGGANIHLHDESFEQFCRRPDLPQFDFIGLHGIWSWISDENRTIIVDFLRRKLKVGGVLYVSYNTQPGWAAMAPVRELMAEHARLMGQGGGIVSRVNESIAFVDKLLSSGALFGRANPQVATRMEALKKQDRSYIAHEYFNQNWVPMSVSETHGWLDGAKLGYACSANLLDHVDGINLTAPQLEILQGIPDRMFRERARDFMVNSQFRRDYWVKGLRPLSPLQRTELLRRQRFILGVAKDAVTMSVTSSLGEASMQDQVYGPILDLMGDHRVHSVQELERVVEGAGIDFNGLIEAITILVGKGCLHPVQDDAAIAAAAPRTRAFNRAVCEQARYTDAVTALASPVTGGAILLSRFEQLLLLARSEGLAGPEDWSRFVLRIMAAQGQRVQKHGKLPESPEEEMATLMELANSFRNTRVAILDALQIRC